jgi:uncharacterized protein with PIN domain
MTDGNIHASVSKLHRAVAELFVEQRKQFANRMLVAPSLYRQLEDLVHGQTGERSGGRPGAPLYVDCLDLLVRIDAESAKMCRGTDNVEIRIQWLINHNYRPQDSALVESWADQITQWTRLAQAILDPDPHWTLPNACPECRTKVVYRTVAGEEVRQPALHITHEGCRCQRCRTLWPPDRFELLAKILNPDGVEV